MRRVSTNKAKGAKKKKQKKGEWPEVRVPKAQCTSEKKQTKLPPKQTKNMSQRKIKTTPTGPEKVLKNYISHEDYSSYMFVFEILKRKIQANGEDCNYCLKEMAEQCSDYETRLIEDRTKLIDKYL